MEKTEWHPAFCAAMRLELRDNPALEFYDEYNLNVDPLRVDLLIIHKPSDVKIDNQIGEFFRENNILEYKSPTDHGYNEYGLYQAMSYVYYYYDRYRTMDVHYLWWSARAILICLNGLTDRVSDIAGDTRAFMIFLICSLSNIRLL